MLILCSSKCCQYQCQSTTLCTLSSSLMETEVQTPWMKPPFSSFSSAATGAGTELAPEHWHGQQCFPCICSSTASEDRNNHLSGNVASQQCSSWLFWLFVCFIRPCYFVLFSFFPSTTPLTIHKVHQWMLGLDLLSLFQRTPLTEIEVVFLNYH